MSDNHIQVLDKSFDIFETLAQSHNALSLSEIVQKTSISKSTVFRILHSMLERGYVEKTSEATYTLGPMMFENVSYHIDSLELQTEAKPYLGALKHELGLAAHLGILKGTSVSYIEEETPHKDAESYTQVGYRSPAYCSSMGKCLLACLSKSELDEVLRDYGFERFTDNTYTDKGTFENYLHQVRKQGWAMDDEEYEIGHRCIAAPIFNYRGDCIASIGVSGSSNDISSDRVPSIAQSVMETAKKVSRRMGYLEQ